MSPGRDAALVLNAAKVEGLDDTVRFEWSAFDAWFEEEERVFVHPRNPVLRVWTPCALTAGSRGVEGRRAG